MARVLALLLLVAASLVHAQPRVQAGVLDLRGWEFGREVLRLEGDWQFARGRFEERPAEGAAAEAVRVPGPWPGEAHGFGTYHLTILCNDARGLSFLVPPANSAQRFYVNGRELARQGNAGTSAAATRAAVARQVVELEGASCPLRVAVQVANFHHRKGGLVEVPRLGTHVRITQQRDRGSSLDSFLIGCFAVMGLLTLLFFAQRRADRTPLWLGLFCASMAVYYELAKERTFERLAVNDADWEPYQKALALAIYGATAFLALFIRSLYPLVAERWAARAIVAASGAAALAVLVMPVRLHSHAEPPMYAVIVAAGAWGVAVLVRQAWKRRNVWSVLLAGMPLLFPVMVLDVLETNTALRYAISPFGLLAFIIAPAAVLARRFAFALRAEDLRAEETRNRMDLLGRATRAGLLDWDAAANATTYSERLKEMLGYPPDADASDWRFFDFIHPEDRERAKDLFRAQLSDRKPGAVRQHPPLEFRLLRAGGGALWVHVESFSTHAPGGRMVRHTASFIDITRHREAERSLRDQIALTDMIVHQMPIAVFLKDPEGRFTMVNRGWSEMTGIPEEKAIGRTVHDLYPEAAAKRFAEEDARLVAQGAAARPYEAVHTGPKPDQYRMVRKAAIARDDGTVLGVISTSTDISELKRIEAQLADDRRRLDLVVRAAGAGIVDWDGKTHQTYYSPRFREIRGYAPDADTSGWPDYFKVMIHPDDRERVTKRWRTFILGKGPEGPLATDYSAEEYRLLRADGSYGWVQVSGVAVRDEKGFVVRWIAAITDIAQRREQEEALRASVRLREEVERLSRHDLKTPLNSVIAVSRLLRDNARLAPEDDELLGTVERAGYRILNMVNLSLDLFRMESGTYQFNPRAVDMVDVARKVAADLESQASSKNIAVRLRQGASPNASPSSLHARAEELLCYSMLANLVKNAIEAAPEGGTVTLRLEEAGEDVRIHVHNGGAVPEAVRGRFFDKYATSGKSAGLGLGTYSARLMARVQGGDIALDTSEEDGTTISITLKAATAADALPTGQEAPARLERTPVPGLPPMRVLVVDDDEFNRLVLRRYLPTPPLTLEMAVNGRAAIDAAARDWPDAVLLDLEMPVMDGYDTARRLREMEREGGRKRPLIVAISSNDDRATMERAIDCGCDDYLVKPAPRETLLRILAGTPHSTNNSPDVSLQAGDPVFLDADLQDTLPGFLDTRRGMLDEMPKALAANDRAAFKRLAHKLAGSFALYGFGWASAQCKRLEREALEGDAADLGRRAAEVRAHLDSVPVRFKPARAG